MKLGFLLIVHHKMSIQFISDRPFACEPMGPRDYPLDLAYRFWFKAEHVEAACNVAWPENAAFHFHGDGTLSVVPPKGKVFVLFHAWAREAVRIGYCAAILLNNTERNIAMDNGILDLHVCGFPDHNRPSVNLSSMVSSLSIPYPINVKFDMPAKSWTMWSSSTHLISPDVLPYAHRIFPEGMPMERLDSFVLEMVE